MSDIFKAIADPTRRAILLRVAEKATNVNALAGDFKMSRPAVSKHIKVLEEADLVQMRTDDQDGRQRNCYAQLEALAEVNEYLSKLQAFWNSKLDGLGAFLDDENIQL